MRNSIVKSFAKKKLIAALLIITFVAPFLMTAKPQESEAFFGMPVVETGMNVITNIVTTSAVTTSASLDVALAGKEFVGDTLLWIAVKIIISKLTNSIVNWINSGFNGNPAFVQNPGAFFSDIGNQVAGNFILNNPDLNLLCSPFGVDVRLAVYEQSPAMRPFDARCTLTDVVANIDNFTADFANGDWIAWNTMVTDPRNNPYGAYQMLKDELAHRVNTKQNTEGQKLNWGHGFLTLEDQYGNAQTPGSIIEGQLNNALGSGFRQLEAADEINEIIGALIGQLSNMALGSAVNGAKKGLRAIGNFSASDAAQLNAVGSGAKAPTPYKYTPPTQTITDRQVIDSAGNPVVDANGNPVTQPDVTITSYGSGYTPGDPTVFGANSAAGGVSSVNGGFGSVGGGVTPPAANGGTLIGGACSSASCTGGVYTDPNGVIYIGGTYTGGTCSGSSCTGGSYSGGTCYSNCGSASGGSTGGGGAPAGNPNLPGSFTTTAPAGSGIACTRSGSTEQFSECSGSNCVGGTGMEIGPNGFWGSYIPTQIAETTQCGACALGTGSRSCDYSPVVGVSQRNCTVTYEQVTDASCF